MRMTHIYKSNKYPFVTCRISQKPRNDRKIKTVQFFLFFFVKYIFSVLRMKQLCSYNQSDEILNHKCYNRKRHTEKTFLDILGIKSYFGVTFELTKR